MAKGYMISYTPHAIWQVATLDDVSWNHGGEMYLNKLWSNRYFRMNRPSCSVLWIPDVLPLNSFNPRINFLRISAKKTDHMTKVWKNAIYTDKGKMVETKARIVPNNFSMPLGQYRRRTYYKSCTSSNRSISGLNQFQAKLTDMVPFHLN